MIPIRPCHLLKSVALISVLSQILPAATILNVSLNTELLVDHPAGPFSVFLVFTDGSGIGDANNTVVVNNLDLGGGTVSGVPLLFGGASGDLATAVTLIDNSFLNLFAQQFTPGNRLAFSLTLTTAENDTGTPDRLTFSILDSSGSPIPTFAPFGDFFLGIDLGVFGASYETFGSDPSRVLSSGHSVSIDAPTATEVPEPATITLLGGGLLAVAVLRYRLLRLAAFSIAHLHYSVTRKWPILPAL